MREAGRWAADTDWTGDTDADSVQALRDFIGDLRGLAVAAIRPTVAAIRPTVAAIRPTVAAIRPNRDLHLWISL